MLLVLPKEMLRGSCSGLPGVLHVLTLSWELCGEGQGQGWCSRPPLAVPTTGEYFVLLRGCCVMICFQDQLKKCSGECKVKMHWHSSLLGDDSLKLPNHFPQLLLKTKQNQNQQNNKKASAIHVIITKKSKLTHCPLF